jgi:hypothetical protein
VCSHGRHACASLACTGWCHHVRMQMYAGMGAGGTAAAVDWHPCCIRTYKSLCPSHASVQRSIAVLRVVRLHLRCSPGWVPRSGHRRTAAPPGTRCLCLLHVAIGFSMCIVGMHGRLLRPGSCSCCVHHNNCRGWHGSARQCAAGEVALLVRLTAFLQCMLPWLYRCGLGLQSRPAVSAAVPCGCAVLGGLLFRAPLLGCSQAAGGGVVQGCRVGGHKLSMHTSAYRISQEDETLFTSQRRGLCRQFCLLFMSSCPCSGNCRARCACSGMWTRCSCNKHVKAASHDEPASAFKR